MKKEQLSSDFTLIAKYVVPTVFLGAMTFAILGLTLEQQYLGTLAVLVVMMVFGSILVFGLGGLKRVQIDSNFIYISNFIKTVEVPISELKSVNETWLINIHPIWITFKKDTEFGRTIVFMPTSDIASSFSKHPITQKLEDIIENENVGNKVQG